MVERQLVLLHVALLDLEDAGWVILQAGNRSAEVAGNLARTDARSFGIL